MTSIQEIVITNWPENLDAMSYSIATLVDDQGKGVAEMNIGDVSTFHTSLCFAASGIVCVVCSFKA